MTDRKAGIGRVTAGIIAVAAMVPYLTLKTLWLTGHPIGITDARFMNDSTMAGLNAMTLGMEAVGLVLALAFTTRWGLRLPAWLVLLPLWVGTGLLSKVVVVVPLQVAAGGLAVFDTGGPIKPWIFMMVYGGFIVQGVALMTAFALYSRDRWPGVFTTPVRHPFPSATRPFQTVVAWGALLVAGPIGVLRLAGGLDTAFEGVLTLAGAAGLVLIVTRRGRGPFWAPLVMAWLGAGALFANGLYVLLIASVQAPLGTPAIGLAELFGTLTGLVMGMCGAFLLTERSGVGDVQAAQHALEGEDGEHDRHPAYHGHR
ncbi:hypothetical protein GBF35_09925 [Nonomuraea phyllanthi]|uniref:hypothetical protein n=1 Tax=Nonomuraea phyllanthi TaxID=2219224 RepID=UPI0012941158|nr:hypothetical protein [Nonomuraea phyllanthi]QFY06962.1 hypothetical protein GBF35_09925 [Nonomuraea phyllanthi]